MHLLTIIGICALGASLAAAAPNPKGKPPKPKDVAVVIYYPNTLINNKNMVNIKCTIQGNGTVVESDRLTLSAAWQAYIGPDAKGGGPYLSGLDAVKFTTSISPFFGYTPQQGHDACKTCMLGGIESGGRGVQCYFQSEIFGTFTDAMTPVNS